MNNWWSVNTLHCLPKIHFLWPAPLQKLFICFNRYVLKIAHYILMYCISIAYLKCFFPLKEARGCCCCHCCCWSCCWQKESNAVNPCTIVIYIFGLLKESHSTGIIGRPLHLKRYSYLDCSVILFTKVTQTWIDKHF